MDAVNGIHFLLHRVGRPVCFTDPDTGLHDRDLFPGLFYALFIMICHDNECRLTKYQDLGIAEFIYMAGNEHTVLWHLL